MQGLTAGRIVHYVLTSIESQISQGQHRPAIIVMVNDLEAGNVSLNVFLNGRGDNRNGKTVKNIQSIPYSEEHTPGSWHWIEPA